MSNAATARIEVVPACAIGCVEEREVIGPFYRVRVAGVPKHRAPEFNTRPQAQAYIDGMK